MPTEVLHRVKVKHRTCGTKTRYVSPADELSYDVDMELHDENNKKNYHQKHDDGTDVIYADVFANEKCYYNNKREAVNKRIERLIKDVYESNNKQNRQRLFAYGEISVPNNLSDEDLKELTKMLGEYLTTKYNRPVILGLHKKVGNNHIHFNICEREYKNGKFLAKRHKIYKDRNGKLIWNKIYKDENGNDIRMPLVPKGEKPIYRQNENGIEYCVNQLKDNRNRLQWDSNTRQGKYLEPEDLKEFHDGIDSVINDFFSGKGYDMIVSRNTEEERGFFKENDLEDEKIGPRNSKNRNEKYQEKSKRNHQRMILRQQFKNEHRIKKKHESELEIQKESAEVLSRELKIIDNRVSQSESALDYSDQELAAAKKDLDIWLLNIFTEHIKHEFQPIKIFNKELANYLPLIKHGMDLIDRDIQIVKNKKELSIREIAKLGLWENNKKQMSQLLTTLQQYIKQDPEYELKYSISERWHRLTHREKASIIFSAAGKDGLQIYREIYNLNGDKEPGLIPNTVDLGTTTRKTFENIPADYKLDKYLDEKLSAQENLQNIIKAEFNKNKKLIESEFHLPPDPAIICVLATLPETYFTLAKEKELNGYVVSPIPKDYYYLAAYNTFKSKLSEIIREENSPYTIEKNRLNSLQNKNLEKLLDKIITVEAKIKLQKQNEEHRRAVFSGKVIKLKSMEDIKTVLRKKYVDDNNKPDYDRIVPRAEHLGFNISVVEKIKDAQKNNYNIWHDKTGNLLDLSKTDQTAEKDRTAARPIPSKKQGEVEIVHEFKITASSKRLEKFVGYFELNEEDSYTHKTFSDATANYHMHIQHKDDHDLSEMERVEKIIYHGWEPGQKR